jgi:hypothetical protein
MYLRETRNIVGNSPQIFRYSPLLSYCCYHSCVCHSHCFCYRSIMFINKHVSFVCITTTLTSIKWCTCHHYTRQVTCVEQDLPIHSKKLDSFRVPYSSIVYLFRVFYSVSFMGGLVLFSSMQVVICILYFDFLDELRKPICNLQIIENKTIKTVMVDNVTKYNNTYHSCMKRQTFKQRKNYDRVRCICVFPMVTYMYTLVELRNWYDCGVTKLIRILELRNWYWYVCGVTKLIRLYSHKVYTIVALENSYDSEITKLIRLWLFVNFAITFIFFVWMKKALLMKYKLIRCAHFLKGALSAKS